MLLKRKVMTNLDSILKRRDITLPTKVHLVKAMLSPVVMYGCESWTIKKLNTEELMFLNCDVGDSWESWDWKEIKLVSPKGNQSWIFIGRTDAEAPILWPPDAKNWLIRKDPDARKDWSRRIRWQQRTRWLDGITNSVDMSWANSGRWWRTGMPGML